jgi:hypothetical protein
MSDFKYSDNDRVIVNGDWATVTDADAAAQRIKDRLLTFITEWFLDLSHGVPYRDNILVKNPRLDVVNAILKTEILKSQDGTFTEFEITLDANRKMTVKYVLDTIFGTISDTVIL